MKPFAEVLLVCVGRREKVGWKSCCAPRVGEGRLGRARGPSPIPVRRGGDDDWASRGVGERVEYVIPRP